jgi:hypothetical protein
MVSSGGDPMIFIPIKDAQQAQFQKIMRQFYKTADVPHKIQFTIGLLIQIY